MSNLRRAASMPSMGPGSGAGRRSHSIRRTSSAHNLHHRGSFPPRGLEEPMPRDMNNLFNVMADLNQMFENLNIPDPDATEHHYEATFPPYMRNVPAVQQEGLNFPKQPVSIRPTPQRVTVPRRSRYKPVAVQPQGASFTYRTKDRHGRPATLEAGVESDIPMYTFWPPALLHETVPEHFKVNADRRRPMHQRAELHSNPMPISHRGRLFLSQGMRSTNFRPMAVNPISALGRAYTSPQGAKHKDINRVHFQRPVAEEPNLPIARLNVGLRRQRSVPKTPYRLTPLPAGTPMAFSQAYKEHPYWEIGNAGTPSQRPPPQELRGWRDPRGGLSSRMSRSETNLAASSSDGAHARSASESRVDEMRRDTSPERGRGAAPREDPRGAIPKKRWWKR